jgi:hypothetical protein
LQALKQENEHVPSHEELVNNFQKTTKKYKEAEHFYSILLVLVIIAFIGYKLFPECLGFSSESKTPEL